MPGSAEIGPYHNSVASDIKKILDETVIFHAPTKVRWDKTRDGSEILFELVYRHPLESEHAKRMRRENGTAHRVSVFPLCTGSSLCAGTFWVSWHESWQKQDSKDFVLLSAGWTLFEGLAGNQDKVQVLRLDWDQRPHAGSRDAGHPHWHFDHELFISAGLDRVEVGEDLVEIPTEDAFGRARKASLGSIHLAMGAWNKDMDHPECWQRTYENDCQKQSDGWVKTLRYLKQQVAGN